MRWCAALAVVLVALLIALARVGVHKPRRIARPADDGRSEAEPRPDPPERFRDEGPPRPTVRHPTSGRPGRGSVAFLHGRVLPPPESEAVDLEDLTEIAVGADDGSQTVFARLTHGGHFSLHLPPGRYTLFAQLGELAGATADVLVGANQAREIDIPLGAGVTIGGTLRGPPGAEVSATAWPVGGSHPMRAQSVEDGKFTLKGLIPGRRYDLVFSGPAVRKATLRSIAAPADALEVALAALPVVRGAIGFLRGETCPIETVSLRGAGIGDDDDARIVPGADCRFELTPPEGASELTVVADGRGWHLEEALSLPAQGDPEPVCFNPPCRADPLEGLGKPEDNVRSVSCRPRSEDLARAADGPPL